MPVLIVGEPGSGKETIARAIHAASLRAKAPMIEVDCKAVPANIIDSELFGHVAGAFPGAFSERVGRMVEADGGTLLLDEIGSLPPETQEMLDRVLATGEVRPVGCNGSNSVDVRVIATAKPPASRPTSSPALAERIAATTVAVPRLARAQRRHPRPRPPFPRALRRAAGDAPAVDRQ